MNYITYAIGSMVVDVFVDEYGQVSINHQHRMSEEEELDASDAGHRFDLTPTIVERRNYPLH